jgi:gentisate 1,2-dioxygenase
MSVRFLDISGFPAAPIKGWSPLVVKKAQIDAEIERLSDESLPEHGIRAARVVHPEAPSFGLAPDIDVTINVLKPGERTTPIRHNSAQVSICIRGSGSATIGSKQIAFSEFDIWNTPAMHPYVYRNDTSELQVRLTYSNGVLLDQLRMHYVEHMPSTGFMLGDNSAKVAKVREARELMEPIILPEGGQLLTYEHLIAPDVVPNEALLWRWADIKRYREELFTPDAIKNKGRRALLVLYNPATGRTVGMTHNFFATMGFMAEGSLDFAHRHSSNAINFALMGHYTSEVDGVLMDWDAGDIAYTAPGWSAHANGSRKQGASLTIQDHPFQIATESLVWQEGEGKPILLLGAQQGFASDDSIELRSVG